MNVRSKLMSTFISLVFLVQPLCADFFQNLDFEDAVIIDLFDFTVDASEALPFWETNGLLFPDRIVYNTLCLGSTCTSIHDEGSEFFPPPFVPLEGTYSINLDAGQGGRFDNCYISQIGTVPDGATSLTLLANNPDPEHFRVSLAGTTLTTLSDFPSNETVRLVYDITSLGGVTGELFISQDDGRFGGAWVDDIRLVPEPSSFLWSAVVCLLVVSSERRRRRLQI